MTGRTRPASGANLTLGTRRSGRSDNRKRPFAALPAWLPVRNERAHERSFAPKTGRLALTPTFSISRFRAGAPSDDNPAGVAEYERIIDGLRKAGVPEG